MPENNYNMIKPVDGLNNLAAINQVGRRKERKKKEHPDKEKKENEFFEETEELEQANDEDKFKESKHHIDFKA